jgi:hypothetical protein
MDLRRKQRDPNQKPCLHPEADSSVPATAGVSSVTVQ